MLNDIKNSYKQCADANLKDWNIISTYDLANLYLDSNDYKIQEGSISALIFRYFNQINRYYNKFKNTITEEECYEVYIESIMDVLDKCIWRDSKHELYKVESSVEAAINTTYQSRMINKYVELNRQKRALNNQTLSIDALKENYDFEIEDEKPLNSFMNIEKIVNDLLNNRNYFMAIVVDKIISTDVIKQLDEDKISYLCYKKLTQEIHEINDDYWFDFQKRYNISSDIINQCKDVIKNIEFKKVRKQIDESISRLRGVVKCL